MDGTARVGVWEGRRGWRLAWIPCAQTSPPACALAWLFAFGRSQPWVKQGWTQPAVGRWAQCAAAASALLCSQRCGTSTPHCCHRFYSCTLSMLLLVLPASLVVQQWSTWCTVLPGNSLSHSCCPLTQLLLPLLLLQWSTWCAAPLGRSPSGTMTAMAAAMAAAAAAGAGACSVGHYIFRFANFWDYSHYGGGGYGSGGGGWGRCAFCWSLRI